jgi:hypothetical protein
MVSDQLRRSNSESMCQLDDIDEAHVPFDEFLGYTRHSPR